MGFQRVRNDWAIFTSLHVWMWELDYKEIWAPKNWCFWTVMLEKTPESPLNCKEIKPVHPKGNQSWIFIGRIDAEAESPILWPPDVKSQLFGKDPDAGTDWGQEEKRVTEDELFGWHHWLNGHKFEQTPGESEGWGGLACCSLWGRQDLVAKQQQRQIIAQLLRAVPLPNIWQYWGGSLCNQVHDLISEARLISLLQRNTPLKGCVYSYGLFVLLYGRNQQNIVKHLKNRKKV